MSKKISRASLDLISGSCCVYASKRDKNYAKQKWKVYKFSIDTFRFIQIFFSILVLFLTEEAYSHKVVLEQTLKSSLSTKILSINDFVTKLLRDFSNRVHLKSISKFINKVINRQHFCRWTCF